MINLLLVTMAIDTPATIAVLGAGPIGIEAALYARYLGYDVHIFDRGRVASHVQRWGHVPMFTPFGKNSSNLGLAALKAQNPNWLRPSEDSLLTGNDYAARYLVPLSQSDLLVDTLHERNEVVAVGREGLLKGDLAEDETRGDGLFRLLIRATDETGHVDEHIFTADVVIDATGTFGTPNWLGEGGIPALGERAARPHIEYGLPDVHDTERGRYANRSVLVVGDGCSAATNVVALTELARYSPDTWITWITCREPANVHVGPVPLVGGDLCPQRDRVCRTANELARNDCNHVSWWPGTWVDAVSWHGDLDHFKIRLSGRHAGELQVDRVIGNVGYRGDHALAAALHTLLDPVTEASPADLIQPEPNFYVLGAKGYGRQSEFLIADGLNQIRQLFAILGDRPSLDLYASVVNLV